MKAFFDTVRPLFRGRLSQPQVDGINAILDGCRGMPQAQIAYCLATAFHEVGETMQPVREGFKATDEGAIAYVTRMHADGVISRNYALPDDETGLSYFGRGLVQITWGDNYKRIGDRLGIPLYENPDLALEMAHAVEIMVTGMREGLFTGRRLDQYITPERANFVSARKIVNGMDRAHMIAGYARTFHDGLRAAARDRVRGAA